MNAEFFRLVENCLFVSDAECLCQSENVALEVPVYISYNGTYFSIAATTPRDFEDFAYGYSLTNGFVARADDIIDLQIDAVGQGFDMQIRLREGLAVPQESFQLSAISGLSCAEGLPNLQKVGSPRYLARNYAPVPCEAIWRASSNLLSQQDMHRLTGATHGAAFVDRAGNFLYMREDIGRHNAVDKLIGSLVRNQVDPASGFVYLSSRCALELVAKIERYGISLVATVSAPTSAVLGFAEAANMTLCAFARDRRFTVYTHPENVILPGE